MNKVEGTSRSLPFFKSVSKKIKAQKSVPVKPMHASPPVQGKVLNISVPRMEKQLREYALLPKDSDIMHPVARFFRTFHFKLRVLFGCRPNQQERVETNHRLLANIIHAIPKTKDCPRSIALDYVYQHLVREGKQEDQALIKALKFCRDRARTVEQLQGTSNPLSRLTFRSLVKDTQKQVSKLKQGEKLLVPGGQFVDGKWQDALYEVERTATHQFRMRVISLDEELVKFSPGEKDLETGKAKHSPSWTFENVEEQVLKSSLLFLYQIQFQQEGDKAKGSSFLGERFKTLMKLNSDETGKPSKAVGTGNALQMMRSFYGSDPIPSESVKSTFHDTASAMRTVFAAMRLENPETFKKSKLENEISAFLLIASDSKDLFGNQAFRETMHASGRKLLFELSKRQSKLGISDEELHAVSKQINEVLANLERADTQKYQKSLKDFSISSFKELFKLGSPLNSKNWGPLKVAPAKSDVVAPIDLQIGKASIADVQKNLEAGLVQCQELYNKGNYKLLDAKILEIVSQLPIPQKKDDEYEKIADQQLVPWSRHIYQLSELMLEAYRMLQPTTVSTDHLLAQATLETVADRLMHLNKNDHFFTGMNRIYFPIHLKELTEGDYYGALQTNNKPSKGAYLRVTSGAKQAKIKAIESYLEGLHNFSFSTGYTEVNFTSGFLFEDLNIKIAAGNSSSEVKYIEELLKLQGSEVNVSNVEKGLKELEFKEGSSILPEQVIQMRKMQLFGNVLKRNNRNLEIDGFFDHLTSLNKMVQNAGGSTDSMTKSEVNDAFEEQKRLRMLEQLSKEAPVNGKGVRQPPKWSFSKNGFKFGSLAFHHYLSDQEENAILQQTKGSGKHLSPKKDEEVVKLRLCPTNNDDKTRLTPQTVVNTESDAEMVLLKGMQTGKSRLEQTIATFLGHPELFDDASNQRIFELNVFNHGVLFAKLKKQPLYAVEVQKSLHNIYSLAVGLGNIPRALFVLRMQERLHEFVEHTEMPAPMKQKALEQAPDSKVQYATLYATAKNKEEKRAILGQELGHALHMMEQGKGDTLDQKELAKKALTGWFLINNLVPAKEKRDPEVEAEVHALITKLQYTLQGLCNDPAVRNELLEAIFYEMEGIALPAEQIKGEYPLYQIGDYRVDLVKGELTYKSDVKGLLPGDVQRVLQENHMILEGEDCLISYRQDKSNGTPITIYARQDMKAIRTEDRGIVLHRKLAADQKGAKKEWMEHVPTNSEAKKALPEELAGLIGKHQVWRKLSDPSTLLIFDTTSGKRLHRVQLEMHNGQARVKKVIRFSDGLELLNPWKTNSQALGQLTAVESKGNILVWGKGKSIKEVQYPRFIMGDGQPLTYEAKGTKKRQQLVSRQTEGYQLPLQRPLLTKGGQEILPPGFQNYQIVQHANGTKKVLMPLKPLAHHGIQGSSDASKAARFASWSDMTSVDEAANAADKQTLFEFDVDGIKNTLKTEDKRAKLYLTYVFFTHKRYERALELLRESDTSLAMLPSHEAIYTWMADWKDETQEGNAFKLHAMLALVEHKAKTGVPAAAFAEEYKEYKQLSQHMAKYEKEKADLSSGLLLTEKEIATYKQLTESLVYPAVSKKGPAPEKTLKAESLALSVPDSKKLEAADFLANVLYLNLDLSQKPPKTDAQCAAYQDPDQFVKGFKALYDGIYQAPLGSLEYQKLKAIAFYTPHQNHLQAGALQPFLQALVVVKEKNPADYDTYAFPQIKLPLLFKMIKMMDDKNVSVIGGVLGKLQHSAPKEAEPEPNKPAEWDFDPAKVAIEPNAKEQQALGKIIAQMGVNDPQDLLKPEMIQQLQEEGHIQKAVDLHKVTALEHRHHEMAQFVKDHPAEPLPKLTQAKAKERVLPVQDNWMHGVFDRMTHPKKAEANEGKFFDHFTKADSKQVAPCVKDLAKKYQADTHEFIHAKEAADYKFKPEVKAEKLIQDLTASKDGAQIQREELEKNILATLNTTQGVKAQIKGALAPQLQKVPDRLIGLYVERKMDQANAVLGLTLAPAALNELEKQVEQYMAAVVAENMAERALQIATSLPTDLSQASSDQVQELYQAILAERHFDIHGGADSLSREMLAIEYQLSFVLRGNQIDNIYAMLTDPNQVRQLGMGEGKTSVILPMLLKRLADGNKLAVGILPEWMYESVGLDLDRNCRAFFGQELIRFEFDRNTKMTDEWLLRQYVNLSSAIKDKDAVITTKTYLLSFRDKFLELMKEIESAPEDQKLDLHIQLALMGEILMLFKTHGYAIADEVDSILDIRQELNYALGSLEKLDKSKIEMGLAIYKKILGWQNCALPELRTYAQKLKKNEQASFNADDVKTIQNTLAMDFFMEWQAKLAPVDSKQFVDFLSGALKAEDAKDWLNAEGMPVVLEAVKKDHPELYKQIGYVRQYLIHTLPTTLKNSGNVGYGRKGKDTVPYKASNVPSEAEFGESFERIAYLIQDYTQNGIKQDQVQAWLKTLLALVNAKMYEKMVETGTMGKYEDTQIVKDFKAQYPKMDIAQAAGDPVAQKKLTAMFNASDDNKLEFIRNWVLPTIEMASKQVSSNALDLAELLYSLSGFTGTPYNIDTYHSKIDTKNAETKGTDGKSIVLLQQMAAQGDLHIRSFHLDTDKPLESFQKAFPDLLETYDAIIDAGAYMKGLDNQAVANGLGDMGKSQKQAGTLKKKAVAFVDADNQKVVQDFGSHSPDLLDNRKDIGLGDRITFFGQGNATGTNIPHKLKARAGVTIGENMYLKNLLQAIWRMRKLDKGQKIDFLISDNVKKLIIEARPAHYPNKLSPVITVEDIILFCVKNQAERVSDDNLRADQRRMNGIVPNALFLDFAAKAASQYVALMAAVGQQGLPEESEKLMEDFLQFEKYLFRESIDDNDEFVKVAMKDEPHKVLDEMRNKLVQAYEDVEKKIGHHEALHKGIADLKAYQFLPAEKLPPEMDKTTSDAKDSQVETQRQQQQQISVESKQMNQLTGDKAKWKSWIFPPVTFNDINFVSWKTVQEAIPFFDNGIAISPNFLDSKKNKKKTPTEALLDPKRLPVQQVVIYKDFKKKKWAAGLIDSVEYDKYITKLKPSVLQKKQVAVFDIRPQKGPMLLTSSEDYGTDPWYMSAKDREEYHQLLVQVKLLDGYVDFFDKEERQALEKWLSTQDKAKFRTFFVNKLLKPSQAGAYETSILRKMLEN